MKQLKIAKSIIASEKGTATVETVPLLFIFVALLSYTLGAFGIIHTGILNSIAARTYAFETFRNRANVTYFRDSPGTTDLIHYKNIGSRIHGIATEKPYSTSGGKAEFFATERPIRIGVGGLNPVGRDKTTHMEKVPGIALNTRNQIAVDPIWVITQYGICINSQCGD